MKHPWRVLPAFLVFLVAVGLAAISITPAPAGPQGQPGAVPQTSKKTAPPGDASTEAIRLNNLGVAYMGQQRFDQALKLFEQAYALDPKLFIARLNQGIALLNKQQLEEARAALAEAAERLPKDPRTWYNLGLVSKNQGQPEQGLDAFGRAVALVPNDADTHYFLGLLYSQLQKYDESIAAFTRALAINPFHVSAEFGLARAYQRKGDSAAARQHLARFQKLTQEKLGAAMSLNYGDQGPYSLAELVVSSVPTVPAAIPVRFASVAGEAGLRGDAAAKGALFSGAGACFLDYDNDGRPDLFLVNGGSEGTSALFRNLGGGRFEDVTRAAKLDVPGAGLGCAAGDYDNDGWTDLAVAFEDGFKLFRNQGDGTFRDVTEAAGIRRDKGFVSLTFVDYDHDGDLDLYVLRGRRAAEGTDDQSRASGPLLRNVLWRNNGNGTFTDWSEPTGLGTVGPSAGVVATDFNNDRAVDLVITGSGATAAIFLNPREGRFQVLPAWDPQEEKLPPTLGVVALDFDKDGWMDLAFTHDGAPGLTLWRNVQGKRLQRVPLPKLDWAHGYGVAAIDYDNDGWIDLAAVGETSGGEGRIVVLRNRGAEGFEDVTAAVGLAGLNLVHPRALITADYDADGDSDLLITQYGGPPVLLRNEGGNKNNWLRLTLKALGDNKSAIGTKVEVYAGPLYQKWEVPGASGYLGQSATEVIAGLGSAKEAELVRLLWPTGVPQDEVQLAARASHSVAELDRRGSSCPILFAWNGRRYEFIADMIGPGIVGHWVAPGERNIPDPTEYLKVEGARVRPRHARLSFRFAEPMEEVVYLDQARLLAVDHPAGMEVFPNERFASEPPFPEFKVISSRSARPPRGAWDEHRRDVLPELAARDRRYVTGFGPSPFKGFAQTHWVELDLGEWNPKAPIRLLLHGFTDYFTATSVYAAHQAGVTPIVPYVEALDAAGRWVRIVDDMGFPAGLARTMVADLTGRLPAGTRRIRIVTNLKIYWDQILIDTTPDTHQYRITEVTLAEAKLGFLGYPRERHGNPPSDITYVHEQVSSTGPYARQAGAYTRYGDVTELLKDADEKFVIFGSGEEVSLEFDPAGLPALPPGWTRDYFFFVDGFTKDMDFYAAHADTVEPLPYHTMIPYPYPESQGYPSGDPYVEYQLNFNTRQLSGRGVSAYRFQFPQSNNP